ncbi:DUF4867 family protein [Mediterraneibacter glycyrrhizinilyticus]|nr:DUF4867 family protein [Mediterraneibacter glycyrrhizinilyticus]MBM6855018.1 DUF4867 family protein [Mediterraneibacter glycyrrhizinilyticus]
MKIMELTDASFGRYGKVVTEFSFEKILKEMEHTPLPKDVVYVPSVEQLEEVPEAVELCRKGFGGLPIQIGYCNGDNHKLNALEYHRSSEIDIAVTDLILLLGRQQDIEEGDLYDTSKVEAFFVPAGTAVELYATTLHYAPCTAAEGGFRCVIVLPRGTNESLSFETAKEGENRLLTAVNKWLIAHEEAEIEGAVCGLRGENLEV